MTEIRLQGYLEADTGAITAARFVIDFAPGQRTFRYEAGDDAFTEIAFTQGAPLAYVLNGTEVFLERQAI
jgi:hypothetical protein